MTEEEKVKNMERCPRFMACDIPKCPLDEDMDLRLELPEDKICPLRRISERKKRTKNREHDILSSAMRKLLPYVPSGNLIKPKTTQSSSSSSNLGDVLTEKAK